MKPGQPPNRECDLRDLEIINRNAERLNREARDVLDYQKLSLDDAPPPAEPE